MWEQERAASTRIRAQGPTHQRLPPILCTPHGPHLSSAHPTYLIHSLRTPRIPSILCAPHGSHPPSAHPTHLIHPLRTPRISSTLCTPHVCHPPSARPTHLIHPLHTPRMPPTPSARPTHLIHPLHTPCMPSTLCAGVRPIPSLSVRGGHRPRKRSKLKPRTGGAGGGTRFCEKVWRTCPRGSAYIISVFALPQHSIFVVTFIGFISCRANMNL